MENSVSEVSNLKDFRQLFLEKYPQPTNLFNMGGSCTLIAQALESKNWDVAKRYCIIRHWYITKYCGKQQTEAFWPDLENNFETTIKSYEDKYNLDWSELLNAELKFTRARSTREYVQKILKALIDNNMITLNDTIHRLKVFFKAFDLGAKFQEPEFYLKGVTYTESLEYYIATSKNIRKSDRLQILSFLAKRGALTLEPSGFQKISTPFMLIIKSNILALKIFLRHPEIHKLKDYRGKTILHHLFKYYPMMPFLKNFTYEQLKYMLKQSSEKSEIRQWNNRIIIKETPLDVMLSSRGVYPSMFFRAIKELILERQIVGEFLKKPTYSTLGFQGRYFLASLGVRNDDIQMVLHNYAKAVRKNKGKAKLISPGDTTFPLESLPLEIAHLIFVELDYASTRSLLSVSRAVFNLKTKFSEVMYNELIRKEFPANTGYSVKGRRGYFNLAKRYTNWKNGVFNVRQIEWSKTRPRIEPRMCTMDENWLAFRTDREFKLWDCHNDEIHPLDGFNIDTLTSISYLESRPGEIPVVVGFSTNQYSVIVTGRSAQKVIKNVTGPGSGGLFAEAIDNDRVFIGGIGRVYSVEKEKEVGQLQVESYRMTHGKLNPLNDLIFTYMVNDNDKLIAAFDKNYTKVASVAVEKNFDGGFRFVDEHTIVATRFDCSAIWDLRKSDQPREFVNMRIDNMYCNRYALTSYAEQRQAVIWDLVTGQWETSIILPDDIRYQPMGNSRYVCWETFKPIFCLLDFQT